MRATCGILSVVAAAGLASRAAAQQTEIYFTEIFLPGLENGSIQRMFVDPPSTPAPVIVTGGGLRSLDVDAAGGKVYWVDVDNFALRRANLDGTGQEDVLASGFQFPAAVRLDIPRGYAYVGDQSAEAIFRVNLASPLAELMVSTTFFRGLALVGDHPIVVWSRDLTTTTGSAHWYDLQNANNGTVVQGVGKPLSVAVDPTNSKVYWTDRVLNRVSRANLDGTGVETLVNLSRPPRGIAVDAAGGKIYWGEDISDESNDGAIARANLDGTGSEYVAFGIGLVNDIVVVRPSGPAPCYANCDASTTAPVLNVLDFNCFINRFSAGESYANCDGSTSPPVLNVLDFNCFINRFTGGCP
jgi:DNA-binding beta-propeller fold protein YncE